jgi:hypothetical protein
MEEFRKSFAGTELGNLLPVELWRRQIAGAQNISDSSAAKSATRRWTVGQPPPAT